MNRYEMLDHAADVMVRCTGRDLEECFGNAAYAMFDQIVDAERIDNVLERTVEISAEDDEERLYSFLSELLFIMDTESVVFNSFKVTFDGDKFGDGFEIIFQTFTELTRHEISPTDVAFMDLVCTNITTRCRNIKCRERFFCGDLAKKHLFLCE